VTVLTRVDDVQHLEPETWATWLPHLAVPEHTCDLHFSHQNERCKRGQELQKQGSPIRLAGELRNELFQRPERLDRAAVQADIS
jgi:hypothetical protein